MTVIGSAARLNAKKNPAGDKDELKIIVGLAQKISQV
jgi:hypothetical protein